MLTCSKCGHEQSVGKFCGKCGGPLEEKVQTHVEEQAPEEPQTEPTQTPQAAEAATSTSAEEVQPKETVTPEQAAHPSEEASAAAQQTAAQQAAATEGAQTAHQAAPTPQGAQTNDQTAEIKEHVQSYWKFATNLLKNPTTAMHSPDHKYTYGIVNFILYAVTYSLTIIALMKSTLGIFSGIIDEDIPYFGVFFRVSFYIIVLLAVVVLGVFLIERIMIKEGNLQVVISQVGGLMTPIIALQLVAILFALGGAITLVLLLMLLTLFLALIIMPTLYIYEKSKAHIGGQKVYLGVSTVIVNSIFVYIVTRIFAASIISNIIDDLPYLFW